MLLISDTQRSPLNHVPSTLTISAADCQGDFVATCSMFMHEMFCCGFYIGTTNLLKQHRPVADQLDKEDQATVTTCNKDTGGKRRLQKWTRGVWFCVSGGGHIQMWQPLYK